MNRSFWKTALQKTMQDPCGWSFFIVVSIGLFLLLLLIPVWTTPGHDVLFQLHLLGPIGTAIIAVLALGNGLLITMQLTIHHEKQHRSLKHKAAQTTTLAGILLGSITATFACAACYSSVLAIFGFGATAFLVNFQTPISIAAIGLTATAIYYAAKRLNNACAVCSIG